MQFLRSFTEWMVRAPARQEEQDLDLPIAKEIVELHHGTIRAESDEWETRFIVTLPAMSEGE